MSSDDGFTARMNATAASYRGEDAPRPRIKDMRASTVTPKRVDWLWFPFIPLGKITVLAGQMGQAKSLATSWLAAAVTTTNGIDMRNPGSVIVLNAEDDPEDTIRPRLEGAGADLNKVWIEPGISIDVDRLAAVADELRDLRLITIDPIAAFLPSNVDSWKSQAVRGALEPLRIFAASRGVAVVLVQHLNRRSDAGDPLARIADSQGIPQLARSVLVWGPDPADPEGDQGGQKALTRAKGNLARSSASATFSIETRAVTGGITIPILKRGEDRNITAEDVVSDNEARSAVEEAADFLKHLLADGPMEAKEARRMVRDNGISDRTLARAKKKAGVRSEQSRAESGITGWQWTTSNKTLGIVGSVGTVGDVQGAKDAKSAYVAKPLSALTADVHEEDAA